jgi:GH25 family lysozyme M1 (1,4-beta-N-acetylmuramidase)
MNKLRRVTILRAVAASGVAMALSLATAADAHGAVTEAGGAPLRGLDISAYQHAGSPIEWGLLAKQGIRFVAIKVSEGTYYVNPYYPSDARAAAAAGLAVLPYVFANPRRADGTTTASFAVSAMGSDRGRLPLVVDLENDPYDKTAICYRLGIPAMLVWITRFTAQAAALTGKWPVIYTTATWWQQCTGSAGQIRRDPLWLAAFDGTPPTVPFPWGDWTFWQYSNDSFLAGIGQVDLDFYQPTGNLPALNAPTRRASKKRPKPERHLESRPAKRKRTYRKS